MFASFQRNLKEVFAVTVLKEGELNRQSAALALAGLIQQYAYAPRFATHHQRLASFEGTATVGPSPSPSELAGVGFFHTGRGDESVCASCLVGLRDWQPTDGDAEAVHALFARRRCLYLATRRLLTSALPLARKRLAPHTPGAPSGNSYCLEDQEAASLVERLATIAKELEPETDCWPVQNALALGYRWDVIVLALWRLQEQKTTNECGDRALQHDWTIDVQGTTDLLKVILRIQECGVGDGFDTHEPYGGDESVGEDSRTLTQPLAPTAVDSSASSESPREDAEVAGLSRQPETSLARDRVAGRRPSVVRLPNLASLVKWWSQNWPHVAVAESGECNPYDLTITHHRPANSTSALLRARVPGSPVDRSIFT